MKNNYTLYIILVQCALQLLHVTLGSILSNFPFCYNVSAAIHLQRKKLSSNKYSPFVHLTSLIHFLHCIVTASSMQTQMCFSGYCRLKYFSIFFKHFFTSSKHFFRITQVILTSYMIAFSFFKDYTPVSLSHFQDILREKNTSFNILHEPGIRVYVIILSKTMNSAKTLWVFLRL